MGDRANALLSMRLEHAVKAANVLHALLFGGDAPVGTSVDDIADWGGNEDEDIDGVVSFKFEDINNADESDYFSGLIALGLPFLVEYDAGDYYEKGKYNYSYDKKDGKYKQFKSVETTEHQVKKMAFEAESLDQLRCDLLDADAKSSVQPDWVFQVVADEHKQDDGNGGYFLTAAMLSCILWGCD